jgi:hypothetical protein
MREHHRETRTVFLEAGDSDVPEDVSLEHWSDPRDLVSSRSIEILRIARALEISQ